MADYSNPYGSNYARLKANKEKFAYLEKHEKKKQEEEARRQREMEEIARNRKRREEKEKAKSFGVELPFAVTIVPDYEVPKTRAEKKERRRTGDWAEKLLRVRKGSDPGKDDEESDVAMNMLRANLEAQRKEILNLTEQLDSKTREVIALRLTLNEVKEERKKTNAMQRERSASLSSPSPSSPVMVPRPTGSPVVSPVASPAPVPNETIVRYEKEVQNLTWQLQLRDTAIEKLKEGLAESKQAAQQAQALAERREEQCRILATKTRELMEAAKQKDLDYELQQDELKKTKALLVSMIRDKKI